jgi:hypothetical protein
LRRDQLRVVMQLTDAAIVLQQSEASVVTVCGEASDDNQSQITESSMGAR